MSKRALVTGSSGFIGRRMVARLRADGWDVTAIDINASNLRERQDVREFFRYEVLCPTKRDLVVHCAARVGGRKGIDGRPTYVGAVNLQLDGALFEWALRTRPAHIIYWSSSAVYPVEYQEFNLPDPRRPGYFDFRLHESMVDLGRPRLPDATYGWAKLTGERLAQEASAEGVRVHVFRPFSGYGDDQSPDYPWPAFVDRARRRADPFDVWGDGQQTRDFIHIDDVVAGALAAVEADHPGPLNLCSGVGVSFNQLAALLCKSAGYSPQICHNLDSPVGVRCRVGDPTDMLRVRAPRVTLEAAVRSALR